MERDLRRNGAKGMGSWGFSHRVTFSTLNNKAEAFVLCVSLGTLYLFMD
jgi:hypothetical protein